MTPEDRKVLRAAGECIAWVDHRELGRVVVSVGHRSAGVMDRIATVIERALHDAARAEDEE